jgi:uncharacterized protein YcbK (DUF882 family)
MEAHIEMLKLVIAYTLVGAFIFTVVATCLSMIGVIKFVNPRQQRKLFAVLVVELVTICLGVFANLLNLSPVQTAEKVQAPLAERVGELKSDVAEQRTEIEAANQRLQKSALDGLQPDAVILANRLISAARSRGIELRVISGYRSPAQQLELFARGRTKPGPIVTSARVSMHSTGLAFDVAITKDGNLTFESDRYAEVGELGKELGLIWGGDARPPDLLHFETATARLALQDLRRILARNPECFSETICTS